MRNLAILSFLFVLGCTPEINREGPSQYFEYNILLGEVDWEGLTREPYNQAFSPNYLTYRVDSVSLRSLANKIDKIEILAFIGTWCEDSQTQMPQFYKILDYLNYDLNQLQIEAMDWNGDGLVFTNLASEHEVSHTPEFIFFRSGIEIGRISEYPVESLEKDMLKIIEEVD